MNEQVLFEWKKYKLTDQSFTYAGHTESLNKIADLEVIEADFKDKLKSGLGLSIWGLLFSFFPGFLVSALLTASSVDNAQEIVTSICVVAFFLLGFLLRAKYTLYITKVSGNKGSIDKDSKCRVEFDTLVSNVKDAIFKHC